MLRSHLVIMGSSVLEIVFVTILSKAFPFCGHGSRRLYETVFCPKVVPVVGLVNLPYIIQKTFERLSISILIKQARECLVELVEGFHAGEDIVGAG